MKIELVKLDVSTYSLSKINLGTGSPETAIYNVRRALSNIIYHPDLKLSMDEAIEREELLRKLENGLENFIFLTPVEFNVIKESLKKVSGWGKDDVELLMRIKEAKVCEINVDENNVFG